MSRLFAVACAAMLGIVAQASLAAEPYGRLLTRAEQVRSADPAAFGGIVTELEAREAEATGHERNRLRYLQAYRQAYSGRYDLAIDSATRLFEATEDVDLKVRAGALIANSRAATREFTEGLIFLDRVLALVGQVRDPESRHHAWSAAGVIYNQVGQHELARHYAELMLADGVEGLTACFAGTLRL